MNDATIYRPRVPPATREYSIRGTTYCVYEWGHDDAPLLMYLHGWGDTGSTFQFVVDALQQDWRIVAPDWRGFGRSSCNCASYWFPDYLADLHALLEIYSPQDPVRLIGHSMGANVASLFAGTMPERVRALVNIEGFGLTDSDPAAAPARYRAWIEMGVSGARFSEYADIAALAGRIGRRHPGMGGAEVRFVATEWGEASPDGVVRLRADPRHKLPNPVLYRRAEAEACWRAIRADTLLVAGADSTFFIDNEDKVTAMFPAANLAVIDGAGHMPHFEAPAELAAVIEAFLQENLVNTSSTV